METKAKNPSHEMENVKNKKLICIKLIEIIVKTAGINKTCLLTFQRETVFLHSLQTGCMHF